MNIYNEAAKQNISHHFLYRNFVALGLQRLNKARGAERHLSEFIWRKKKMKKRRGNLLLWQLDASSHFLMDRRRKVDDPASKRRPGHRTVCT
ncbi:hypothetical protein CDAR_59221 [Caerostris darwini]|uniref:Uncharacterized protein n=1 Tax=Caerostris darwini TaxID=1538125 RepID=A0AAV4X625_9ARAC|nr:hypothetical protein CDAR_59221 [Caerostris darwini]